MKKSTFLKLALVSVAMLLFVGAFAQGTAVPGAATVTFTSTTPIYAVTGTSIPLYAEPDPVYHSAWTYGGPWTLTAGFLWNWSVNNVGNITFDRNGVNDNYVVATAAGAAGTVNIVSVTEEASAAFGGCEGAPTTLTINIVATPAFTLGALDGLTPQYCDGDAGIPATVPVTISGGWQNYRLAWNLEIATLGAGLIKDFYYDDETGAVPAAGQKYAVDYTEAIPEAVAALGAHEIMTVADFLVIDSKPTVYTFQLVSINDQALRFGDYITLVGDASVPEDFTYNAFSGLTGTYTIQVNPAPTTGPIFHIPATWAL